MSHGAGNCVLYMCKSSHNEKITVQQGINLPSDLRSNFMQSEKLNSYNIEQPVDLVHPPALTGIFHTSVHSAC